MTRHFKYEGEEWEVRDLGIKTGAGTVREPKRLEKRAKFQCVSDTTKESIFANIPNRNLDEILDAELCNAIQQDREEAKD